MNIGIICEGDKTDKPVLEVILGYLFPSTRFHIRGLDKGRIFGAGDIDLADMYTHCERVLMIWDLLPIGQNMGIRSQQSMAPCRNEQRQTLLRLLQKTPTCLTLAHHQQACHLAYRYRFDSTEVLHPNRGEDLLALVCVQFALDGWLLSDPDLLRQLGSTPTHQIPPNIRLPHPDECEKPAATLRKFFSSGYNKKLKFYNKYDHNKYIAEKYIEFERVTKMRKSESFRRVVDTIDKWVKS